MMGTQRAVQTGSGQRDGGRNRMSGLKGIGLALVGLLVFATPPAAQAQADPGGATFRIGLGITNLKFASRQLEDTTHRFAILDVGVSKTFGGAFVGFVTELPFNQGGTPTSDESVQTEVGDLTLGYAFESRLSVFTGFHYAKYDFWRAGILSRHKDAGPYAGVGYGFPVGEAGQLSVTVARGDFNGTIGAGPGKTRGNSASLTWSGDFRHGLQYYAKLRVLDYQFELDPDVVTPGVNKRTVEKNITTLALGVVF